MTYTCTRDGATKTETIPALGHKWDDGTITTAPTCETEGEKTYKCTNRRLHRDQDGGRCSVGPRLG